MKLTGVVEEIVHVRELQLSSVDEAKSQGRSLHATAETGDDRHDQTKEHFSFKSQTDL